MIFFYFIKIIFDICILKYMKILKKNINLKLKKIL